jgi:hypothetical protein
LVLEHLPLGAAIEAFEGAQAALWAARAIESTLTKIYAKLGVRSRTQLASLLRDRGSGSQGVDLRVYARARRP